MIRLFIIVLALIAALGAGAAGLVHFAIIPDFSGGLITSLVGVVGAPGPQASAEEEKPKPRVDPVYMPMEPVLIPVIQNGVLKHNVYIAFRIQLNPEKQSEGAFYMGRLHDLYLRALYDIVPEQQKDRDTLDLQKIKERLMVITERTVGPGVVEDIVFIAAFNR